ncbi:Uncharacterised protein [Klebsiella aerogenes]|uniref:Uncharacterized protein n=1 Tax=Klebsiella pneumoniae TaxID=573 RepID=A0A508ZVC5_KLEPN|nr:Uncharacterised protein [Klebsiella aerogenes]VUA85547.1 Uncharacterised protein [Klebsiella pneumoniae]
MSLKGHVFNKDVLIVSISMFFFILCCKNFLLKDSFRWKQCVGCFYCVIFCDRFFCLCQENNKFYFFNIVVGIISHKNLLW